jgi:hypothetical protein
MCALFSMKVLPAGDMRLLRLLQSPFFREFTFFHNFFHECAWCAIADMGLLLPTAVLQAVAVLLTLLNLGVKNIRLGPQLPAFCTPDMIDLLVKTFDLKAVSDTS